MNLEWSDWVIQEVYARVRDREREERIGAIDLPEKVPENIRMILRMVDLLIQERLKKVVWP